MKRGTKRKPKGENRTQNPARGKRLAHFPVDSQVHCRVIDNSKSILAPSTLPRPTPPINSNNNNNRQQLALGYSWLFPPRLVTLPRNETSHQD